MFTAKGVLLLISVILLLIIAWNTDITMVYILFVITFVMFVLSFIHLQLSIPECSLTRELQEIAYEGDMLNVKLTIRNKRGLGFYLFELVDRFMGSAPGKEKISLFILNMEAKEVKKISYAIDCYKRGLWRLGPVAIISQDALGFFRMTRSVKCFSEVLVYPAIFKIFSFPPLASGSVSWMGVETAKISGDSHEFFGIREYQKGDRISRIHWPSTARRNKLIVKQFERNAVQEATIVMDLKKGHDIGVGRETTLEYSVKIAGSIAKYLLNEGAFVQMIGYGKKPTMLPLGKGESHMYKLLDHLAAVQADGDLSLSRTLEEASFITPHRSTLIAIMLDNDMDGLTSLVQFKVKGIKLILIVLSASTFGQIEESGYLGTEDVKRFDEVLAGLEAYVYKVSKGDDLEKKFEMV
jgi:uncharacterized protein (DUF58 family)